MAQPRGAGKENRGGTQPVKATRLAIARVREMSIKVEQTLKGLDLESLRKCGNLSQEKAARVANVSVKTWFRWEQRKSAPNAEALEKICAFVEGQAA